MVIEILPAANDNYMYVLTGGDCLSVVDPTDGRGILEAIREKSQPLSYIFNTHHHFDHTAGNALLANETGAQVIAPEGARIAAVDRRVADGQELRVGGLKMRVIGTPGHCRKDVSFYIPSPGPGEPGVVFTGDTMFVGGCGRLFECGAEELFKSLRRLAELPDDTLVFCGHNFAEENYKFALSIVAESTVFAERLAEVRGMKKSGQPTVPSTIGREKESNIFLLSGNPAVKEALRMSDAPDVEVFAELRRRKDRF
ncbi:MAG: hydroxyacylglutathione hydrolase [Verrucomicrobia bacterium]|nr:hydroxyacylglutathione hydrolase [Verrucomicrobiota bacterium]